MTEGTDLRIGESREQRDDVVHQVLVVNDGILALLHQRLHKVTKVDAEFLPLRSRHDHRILSAFLEQIIIPFKKISLLIDSSIHKNFIVAKLIGPYLLFSINFANKFIMVNLFNRSKNLGVVIELLPHRTLQSSDE